MTSHWLISYSEALDILREEGHLKDREARALLERNEPPPVNHGLHSRRRWRRDLVIDFARSLPEQWVSLGKDAPGAVTTTIVKRTAHVTAR